MRSNASVALLALLLSACGGAREGHGAPLAAGSLSYGAFRDAGLASWYGEEVAGNRTASGERFDPDAFTAAHRTLPLGSFVEVTSLDTGRSVIVRINDRGPGRRDRIIDLSRAAAQSLGTDRLSVANVRVRTILSSPDAAAMLATRKAVSTQAASVGLPPQPPFPKLVPGQSYVIQVATFSNEDRARSLARTLDAEVTSVGGFWRVRLGPYDDPKSLQRARDAVAARGYGDARILPEDR